MRKSSRRRFLSSLGLSMGTASLAHDRLPARPNDPENAASALVNEPQNAVSPIDFRYSPLSWQTAYCFPDDPHKSLVGNRGELLYGHPGRGRGFHLEYFSVTLEFSLLGMEPNRVTEQQLEAPGIPIIHTRLERPEAFLALITFATNQANEGRVDNVILEVRPRTQGELRAIPTLAVRTKHDIDFQELQGAGLVRLGGEAAPLFLATDSPLSLVADTGLGLVFRLKGGVARRDRPLRYFFRLPQEGQSFDKIKASIETPDQLLAEARTYWQNWKPFAGPVSWKLSSPYNDFLVACARNILQAREVKDGKATFQVGPTVYRGLWVVDGNFILEAARYLGYDTDTQQGLEATWARQEADGSIFAGAGREHWKDTGIAMFTLVRQAELSQDWGYFRKMQPNVLRAVKFLLELHDKAKTEGSANGRYGLLPRGFGDGGLAGIRSEFTNTLWVLAGLKAVTEAADRLEPSGFETTKKFYQELRTSFVTAARREMRWHPAGFEYLPILMKEDPQWSESDEWDRPRPQAAQWALSHAIFPGSVFDKDDPVVKGHIALMQACTQEDIPAETGWLPHGGVWNYNAAFVAHVYLWAGLADWARRTFIGFLNHASPLYCWREEQPLRGSVVAKYVGDMPHNWASAECVLYLRHMLALEDGPALRLLAGTGDPELAAGEPFTLVESPTRFGRITLNLEPLDRRRGWQLKFARGSGPTPGRVQLPATLGSQFRFVYITGAKSTREGNTVLIAPEATSWVATWKV